VQRRAYTYRPDSGITTVIDQLGGVREYELDLLGRVTAVTAEGQLERYGYDHNGNVTAPGQTAHDGTLLRAAGNARLEHDADGRVVARHSRTLSGARRSWDYLWNCEDRLIGITTPDRITWRYLYDALGRRVAKLRLNPDNTVAEQTWFAWDGSTVAEQLHSSGHLTCWDYRPGTHRPLTQVEIVGPQEADRRFYAIVSDLVGTPTELVDLNGNVAWRQATTLWGGQLSPPSQPAYCPLRFPGQYHDHESGLHYNFQRYYDPDGAVYLSADPLGLAPGPNPHGYVSNPLRQFDPLGLAPYKLNLGSGQNPMPDAVNMDITPGPGVMSSAARTTCRSGTARSARCTPSTRTATSRCPRRRRASSNRAECCT
jgi:RHS repeat-associated protein